jgi:hypothetical protein
MDVERPNDKTTAQRVSEPSGSIINLAIWIASVFVAYHFTVKFW